MLWPVGCRDVQDQADTQDSFFLCIQVPSWCCRHTGTAGLLRAVTTPARKEAKQCLCPPKSHGECLAQCSFEPESVPSVSSASQSSHVYSTKIFLTPVCSQTEITAQHRYETTLKIQSIGLPPLRLHHRTSWCGWWLLTQSHRFHQRFARDNVGTTPL